MREGTFHHPAIPPSAAPGDMFVGRYELRRTLKSSNAVTTFLARDFETDQDVVVKSIDPGLVHAAARLRFEHETQVLRQLTGAGLSGLYDGGVAGDRLFLVQPLVAGTTLEQELQQGPLSLVDSLRIARDLAAALDIAHGAGICHRDVKPANVMIQGTEPVRTVTLMTSVSRAARGWTSPSVTIWSVRSVTSHRNQ